PILSKVVEKGCPQGSACGPGLWNILYDELLQTTMPDGCELIAFADDLVLLCEKTTEACLELSTNEAIRRVYAWGLKVKLTFNPAKTQVMLITKKRKIRSSQVTLNGSILEFVSKIKYLESFLIEISIGEIT